MSTPTRILLGLTCLVLLVACKRRDPEQGTDTATDTSGTPNAAAAANPSSEQLERAGDIPAPSDVAAPPADAEKTPSGLASKILTPGTGAEHPRAQDRVKVHYTGWTTDGKMFDSSVKRGTPAEFPLSQVIAGWTEGLQLMIVGEKRRLWIPEELAYKGRPGRPAGMLVFDVELLDIAKQPDPPSVPDDLKKPGAGAKTTASGLVSRVLQKGKGSEHPQASSLVTVNYSGWTQSDGQMFDFGSCAVSPPRSP
ncbi:MAG: FKBP-type peptidyl-prolyl cis-trans isomerase [Polyangiales bacterium]